MTAATKHYSVREYSYLMKFDTLTYLAYGAAEPTWATINFVHLVWVWCVNELNNAVKQNVHCFAVLADLEIFV